MADDGPALDAPEPPEKVVVSLKATPGSPQLKEGKKKFKIGGTKQFKVKSPSYYVILQRCRNAKPHPKSTIHTLIKVCTPSTPDGTRTHPEPAYVKVRLAAHGRTAAHS